MHHIPPPSDTNPSESCRTRPLTLDPRLILKHKPNKYFLLIFNVRMSVGQLFLCKDSTLLVQKHQYIAWYCKLVIFLFLVVIINSFFFFFFFRKNSFSHTIPNCTCTSQRHLYIIFDVCIYICKTYFLEHLRL